MAKKFLNTLPEKAEKDELERIRKADPYTLLNQLAEDIQQKYDGKVVGITTSASYDSDDHDNEIKEFSFYLIFNERENYSYRLFEATCLNEDGKYPVKVKAFSGPPVDFKEAKNEQEFGRIIENILKHERTRFIILSNYKS